MSSSPPPGFSTIAAKSAFRSRANIQEKLRNKHLAISYGCLLIKRVSFVFYLTSYISDTDEACLTSVNNTNKACLAVSTTPVSYVWLVSCLLFSISKMTTNLPLLRCYIACFIAGAIDFAKVKAEKLIARQYVEKKIRKKHHYPVGSIWCKKTFLTNILICYSLPICIFEIGEALKFPSISVEFRETNGVDDNAVITVRRETDLETIYPMSLPH